MERMRFAKEVAKVELHCHLNGSVRMSTLCDLAKGKLSQEDEEFLEFIRVETKRPLKICFRIFDLIYKVIDNSMCVRRILRELLEDLREDNVVYAEIRTTPRALIDIGKEEYIAVICDEVNTFLSSQKERGEEQRRRMDVRLIMSIDRSKSVEVAQETLQILRKVLKLGGIYDRIVGLDFGGNPTKNSFLQFEQVFRKAREELKLYTTIHTSELRDSENETDAIVAFGPDRLGHVLCLTRPQVNYLLEKRIPVEICPTSNMRTLRLEELRRHPTLKAWIGHDYPFSISTDDAGVVFDTMPSVELAQVANFAYWSTTEMARFCERTALQSFLPASDRDALRRSMEEHNALLLT